MEIKKFKDTLTEKEFAEFNEDWDKYKKERTRLLQERTRLLKQRRLNKQKSKKE